MSCPSLGCNQDLRPIFLPHIHTFLNISVGGDSTTTLGSPFQGFATLSLKFFLLISNLNLPWKFKITGLMCCTIKNLVDESYEKPSTGQCLFLRHHLSSAIMTSKKHLFRLWNAVVSPHRAKIHGQNEGWGDIAGIWWVWVGRRCPGMCSLDEIFI